MPIKKYYYFLYVRILTIKTSLYHCAKFLRIRKYQIIFKFKNWFVLKFEKDENPDINYFCIAPQKIDIWFWLRPCERWNILIFVVLRKSKHVLFRITYEIIASNLNYYFCKILVPTRIPSRSLGYEFGMQIAGP